MLSVSFFTYAWTLALRLHIVFWLYEWFTNEKVKLYWMVCPCVFGGSLSWPALLLPWSRGSPTFPMADTPSLLFVHRSPSCAQRPWSFSLWRDFLVLIFILIFLPRSSVLKCSPVSSPPRREENESFVNERLYSAMSAAFLSALGSKQNVWDQETLKA